MSNIKPTNPINIDEKLEELQLYKFHPNALVEHSLNMVGDMNDGRVEVLTPSNPVAYVLEQSALNTHFAIMEHTLLTRKMFAVLANNEEDLYLHMSDEDYLNRFSTPAYAKVTFNILYSDFVNKAYEDPITKDKILTIPRNYVTHAENTTYSLTSPIRIRLTETNVLDVRYDNTLTDEIFPLTTNYIPFDMVSRQINGRNFQDETYITFEVRLPELYLETKEIAISKGKLVRGKLTFKGDRLFYYVKAFYWDNNTESWVKMITTHTEDVWDIKTPTCVVKVHTESNELSYYIPPNYIANGMIGDKVKLVVYTTKGPLNIDYADFLLDDFKNQYNKIFPELELDKTSEPHPRIAIKTYIRDRVVDGKPQKTFEELKQDVINNNLTKTIPITNNQVENKLRSTDLTLVKNHDVVTSREYLLKTVIPSSVSRYKVAKMALDLVEFKTSTEDLLNDRNLIKQVANDVIVIPHGTLFEVSGVDGIRILGREERTQLESMTGQNLVKYVNARNYMISYYHYVLDSTNDFTELRAYEDQKPEVVSVNFRDYNETALIGVNTRISELKRTDFGYRMDILVDVKIFNQMYDINNITPIFVYTTSGGNHFYLEGKLYNDTVMGTVFSFYFHTDGYIDDQNRLHIKNFKDVNGAQLGIAINIYDSLDLLYCSNNTPVNFKSTDMDVIINRSYLAGMFKVVTRETHKLRFATHLEHLFTRVHTSTGTKKYKAYEEDVYKQHNKTIFDEKNEIVARPGDYVLDSKGEKIVEWKRGELILDENGKPIEVGEEGYAKYLNILFMDYKFHLSNSVLIDSYKDHVRVFLNSILTNNLPALADEFIEETSVFLTVPNGQTDLRVQYDGYYSYIKPNQSFKFNIYVNRRVHKDKETRQGIENAILETLDAYLTGKRQLSKTDLVEEIKGRIKEFVHSISLEKFTELDAEFIKILNDNGEISINKRLEVSPDGYKVVDDITYNFVDTEVKKEMVG